MKTIFPALLILLCAICARAQTGNTLDTAIGFKDLADLSIPVGEKDLDLRPMASLLNTPSLNCDPGGCHALPVTLLSFEGKRTDVDHVQLNWKTTNELNNLGFYIERSLGNATGFMNIAFVPALPDSGLVKKYALTDPNSFAGTSYYRLKQVDIDSQFVYSKIISVNNTGVLESLTLYPNPAGPVVYLKIVSLKSTMTNIFLYDANGKVVMQQAAFLQKGSNLPQMNVSGLSPGMYFVRLFTEEGITMVQSFIKQ